ncbi:MAG: hypothetical protein E6J88_10640 [Deltaproteobacteria bacterium]|nr:MAG: hypothetical protein E6J88_10640 [Deltaproteobacteria bacterium]
MCGPFGEADLSGGGGGTAVISEQAVLGISDAGDAAVAQLIDADGKDPELSLLIFDRAGGPSRPVATAQAKAARAVAQRVREAGRRPSPILAAALAADWPEAAIRAGELGFEPHPPAMPEPGRRRWLVTGAAEIGSLPLALPRCCCSCRNGPALPPSPAMRSSSPA